MRKSSVDISNKEFEQRAEINPTKPSLSKIELRVYNSLKASFEQIKLHQKGKIKLQNAKEALVEVEASIKANDL
ncbi:hypothetical protein PQ469_23580 [Mucilaginibacter sp. KACC 22773]|uniref:hypothetical protein n=1 Tax=Mucilaginibacter sp. KACC 22773 TaxID=3025671 RepID=UPI002366B5FA|nr:hypothetical protein [Mucilaginibacter sp. KACC 22773]WDF76869.1 hypothetical protein PQ469_23580 [Mucilaginibacter sp. KACC 22773]